MQSKEDFLCIIHDKMDHFKIAMPWLQMKIKMVFGLKKLLVTLTRMIVHGHGDKAFVQYSNELWPNDHNFTIGLFICLFDNLEKEPIRESRILFEFKSQNACFQQIL